MARIGKYVIFCLVVILTVSSLIIVESATAQTIPKPAIPEFKVKFMNASYSVTNTNPYTGTKETQLISNNTIEVTIENQLWEHSNYQIYYNIWVKPHFAGNWTEIYPLRNLTSSYNNGVFTYADYIAPETPIMPNSASIIVSFPVVPTEYYGESGYDVERYFLGDEGQEGHYFAFLHGIPYGSQIDFQVKALVGQNSTYWYVQHPLFPQYGGFDESAIAYETASGWSNTQTITLGEISSSTTPTPTLPNTSPTSSPIQFSNDLAVTLALVAIAVLVISVISLLLYVRKLKKSMPKN